MLLEHLIDNCKVKKKKFEENARMLNEFKIATDLAQFKFKDIKGYHIVLQAAKKITDAAKRDEILCEITIYRNTPYPIALQAAKEITDENKRQEIFCSIAMYETTPISASLEIAKEITDPVKRDEILYTIATYANVHLPIAFQATQMITDANKQHQAFVYILHHYLDKLKADDREGYRIMLEVATKINHGDTFDKIAFTPRSWIEKGLYKKIEDIECQEFWLEAAILLYSRNLQL